MTILQRNYFVSMMVVLLMSLIALLLLSGCEPIKPPDPGTIPMTSSVNPTDSTIVVNGDQATLKISRGVTSTQFINLDDLDPTFWETKWVAFARLVTPPYDRVRLSAENITPDWVVISPDERFESIKHIHLENVAKIFETREAIEYLKPQSDDFEGLVDAQANYWNSERQASLWIESVFISGTLYILPSTLMSSLANAPYLLLCQAPSNNEFSCLLRHRYDPAQNPPERYTAFPASASQTIGQSYFYAEAKIPSALRVQYNTAKCDRDTKICLLDASFPIGPPAWCSWVVDTCKDLGCYSGNGDSYECTIRACAACED